MENYFQSVVIEQVQPIIDGGRYPLKRGRDSVTVSADILKMATTCSLHFCATALAPRTDRCPYGIALSNDAGRLSSPYRMRAATNTRSWPFRMHSSAGARSGEKKQAAGMDATSEIPGRPAGC